MLLDEVNQKFSGTYDFFYLPIDFKNRCNVGYCFINFLGPQSIAAFVEDFHGQKWKNFNSEKVCAVSFARIQGKQAMIARFENSSLMDKVDEYKPLLFYSTGINMGKPEPFPNVVNKTIPSDEKAFEDSPQQAST
jgi:protein phosphatase 1 regulatory subunit 42